jgi:hypothetical protein
MLPKTKHLSDKNKKFILQKQNNKCANSNNNYTCLLWIVNNGFFDESGYQFVYDTTNPEALCPNCHTIKMKRLKNENNIKKISVSSSVTSVFTTTVSIDNSTEKSNDSSIDMDIC